jgi:UDP-N-acetylmuramyl pentapeptide phosphotransferase/UDP-N-acetylglucosamine-1-phosphate transferase
MDLKSYLRTQRDRVTAMLLVAGGGLALLLGWIGVSGTALSHEQLPYVVSGGLFGIVLVGLGATLWLSADLRDEWRKLDRLEQGLADATAALTQAQPTRPSRRRTGTPGA